MEVKPGYKLTEMGVIPSDWNTTELKMVCSMKSGESITAAKIDQASQYPCYGGNGLRGYTSRFTHDGTFALIGRQGALCGNVTGVSGKFFASEHAVVVTARTGMDIGFLTFILGEMRLNRHSESSAQPGLSVSKVFKLPWALPPTESEQRAIATALREMDALLGGLDRLIAKKRDLKQAAMQQLLTGQTRLPDFHGDWEQVPLGDLFSFKNGLNKAKEFFGHGTPIVNYMDVFGSSVIHASSLEGRVSLSRAELKNFDVQKGDVFFTRTSETTEEVGMASVMLDEPTDTVFSGFVLRARPINERLYDGFKAYCFGSASVRKQITSKASYTTRALTNGRILSEVILPLPPLLEQTAIATVLMEMDAELVALQARRNKTHAIKRAMMQELLTGRTRLV